MPPPVKKPTRIQTENREIILEAALEIFAENGFRGSTIDQIATQAGMSKPNLLYYYPSKESMHLALLDRLLVTWLDPLRELDENGEPMDEILNYVRRKLQLARDFPRESRLFANEILQGAPRIADLLSGELREIVDTKAAVIAEWMNEGRLARRDPRHLIFSIWATTQHYADFDVQIRAVLDDKGKNCARFDTAEEFLTGLFEGGLRI